MIANRPDWTLSRQRQWGVPMPFFVHRETGALHPRTLELLEQVAAARRAGRHRGLVRASAEDFGVDGARYEKIKDTLDVWFDSGSTHQTVMGGPRGRETGAGSHSPRRLSRRPLPRGLRPAPRLVPLVAARLVHAERRAAVQGAAHARLRRRRRRQEDVEVQGQRHRAAEGVRDARRRDPAAVGRRHRLLGRAVDLRRDPEARGRELSPHPQHAALPARQHRRLRSGAARDAGRRAARDRPLRARRRAARWPTRSAPTTRATSSTSSSSGCRRSAPRTSAAFYLDVLKDRLYTAGRDSPARRSAQTALVAIRDVLLRADGADPVVHRRGGVADRASGDASVFCQTGTTLPPAPADAAALRGEVDAHPRRARRRC